MRDLNELRRLAEMADAVAPTGWEADRERMTDAPDKHHEFFAIDGAGNRMFGTENADAAFGLIEVEDDGDGFTSAWNENSRRVIEFAVAAQPTTVISLLDRLEQAEAEIKDLRSEIDCYETEAEDLRNETGVADLEGQVMSSREENARLRGLLAEAGEALEPFAAQAVYYDPDEGDGELPVWDFEPKTRELRTARTVADKIEEALK